MNTTVEFLGGNPFNLMAFQVYLDKETGIPLPPSASYRDRWLAKEIRPRMTGTPEYFAVLPTPIGPLVVISDQKQTRYYWDLKSRDAKTYLLGNVVRSADKAVSQLYSALLLDDRINSVTLYRSLAPYFADQLPTMNSSIIDEGNWNGKQVLVEAELLDNHRARITVLYPEGGVEKQISDLVEYSTHPLVKLLGGKYYKGGKSFVSKGLVKTH